MRDAAGTPRRVGWLAPALREVARSAALVSALIVGLYCVVTERVGLTKDDAGQYARMADDPAYAARLPYTFRVLTPGLAGLWPGDHIAGFTLVTLVGLVVAGTCLFGYGRAIGLSEPAALAGAALFAVSGGSIRLLTTPVYVDAVTYATTVAALLCLALGRFRLFLTAVTLGVLNRETALLLIPVSLFVRPPTWERLGRIVAVVVVPLAALAVVVVLKLWAAGVLSGELPLAALAPFGRTFRQDIPSLSDLFDLYSTFGVLWVLALTRLPGPAGMARRVLLFGLFVVLQLVVSRGDEGRNLSHLFPIVIPLAMLDLERMRGMTGRSGIAWAALLVLGAAASMVNARWAIFEPAALRYALVATGTALALVAAWRLRFFGRPRTRQGAGSVAELIPGGAE